MEELTEKIRRIYEAAKLVIAEMFDQKQCPKGVSVTVPIKSIGFSRLRELSEESLEEHAKLIKSKLEHYANRKLTDFFQFDCFCGNSPDSHPKPDENGMCVFSGETQELMSGAYDVRVLIARRKVQNKAEVVQAIRKVADWIESNEKSMIASCLREEESTPF